MHTNNYAVIMAGGIGTRFWPLSNSKRPKQFIDILGTGRTLIQQTFDRLKRVCPPENILIVTGQNFLNLVKEQIPEIAVENILTEPFRRNTAPCIAYAAYKIKSRCKEANIIVAPSDHIIIDESLFADYLKTGLDFVGTTENILTLGVVPHRPEPGYGYIQINSDYPGFTNIKKVKTFTEKPNPELAEIFYQSGDFLWNSGIFLWNVNTILKAFKLYLPNLTTLFENGLNNLNTERELEYIHEVYAESHGISIDYGIMEKANNVCVLSADFGWSDLGSWKSFHEQSHKDKNNNVVNAGKNELINTKDSIIHMPKNKTVIIEGLDNYIVAEYDDILLICNRNEESRIKQFAEKLKFKE